MINIILALFIIILALASLIEKPIEIESISHSKEIEMKNIPDSLQHNVSYDEILNELSTKKYHKCKASVLFNPKRSLFYLNNPAMQIPNKLSSYIPLKCKMLDSYISWSKAQKFYIPFKDIEQILDNNEDSILQNVIHEITNLQQGIEVSFYPVKFYRKSEVNIKDDKMFLCYDSIKVLGFDKRNNLYFLITAGDYHEVIHCESHKTILGNLIRYSTYCYELCNDDYIYYSNDLIKCKCDDKTDVPSANSLMGSNTNHYLIPDKSLNMPLIIAKPKQNEVKILSIINKYTYFAHQNELNKVKAQLEKKDISYLRFYFHSLSIIVSLQIVYVFCIREKANFFVKFNVIFYVFIIIILYIAFCIKSWCFEINFLLLKQISEVIGDIYPLFVLLYLSFLSNRHFSSNEFNPYWSMMILNIVMTLNSLDYVLKDIAINEIDLIFKGISIVLLMFIKNTEPYMYIFCLMFRMKMLLDLITRCSLFSIEKGVMLNISVPFFIIFGKNKDSYLYTSKLLFQSNYIKLFPYLHYLNGNWFMEALNFSKKNDIIILMQCIRYFILVYFAHCVILCDSGLINFVSAISQLNLMRIIGWNVQIAFKLPLLTKKKISLLFFLFMISEVLCTLDCMWIYLVHCGIGLLYKWLYEENRLSMSKGNKSNEHPVKRVLTSRNFRILSRLNTNDEQNNNNEVHSD